MIYNATIVKYRSVLYILNNKEDSKMRRKLIKDIKLTPETFTRLMKLKGLLQAKTPEKEVIFEDVVQYLLGKLKGVE